jgi:hypothetical protein
MDGTWVFAAVGAVSGAFFVLNTALDHIPRFARRVVKAVDAMKEVRAAIKAPGRK